MSSDLFGVESNLAYHPVKHHSGEALEPIKLDWRWSAPARQVLYSIHFYFRSLKYALDERRVTIERSISPYIDKPSCNLRLIRTHRWDQEDLGVLADMLEARAVTDLDKMPDVYCIFGRPLPLVAS